MLTGGNRLSVGASFYALPLYFVSVWREFLLRRCYEAGSIEPCHYPASALAVIVSLGRSRFKNMWLIVLTSPRADFALLPSGFSSHLSQQLLY
jgi:hypothetical protein